MEIDLLKKFVLIMISIFLFAFLFQYLKIYKLFSELLIVLLPVFIGFFYAWLLNPIIRKFSKKTPRSVVCIIIFFMVIIIMILFFYFLIPTIMKELGDFMNVFPTFLSHLREKVGKFGGLEYLEELTSIVMDKFPNTLLWGIKKIALVVGNIVIGFILGLYISFEYESFIRFLFNFLHKKKLDDLVIQLSDGVRSCIYGTFLVALFVFILDSLFFFFIGLDAPLLLGLFCGLTDFVPYVGPYIGGGLAVLVGFNEKKMIGYFTLLVCFIVQFLENYVFQPMVMSKSVHIRPIFILISLLIMGRLFGIVGMLFSTPILTMIKIIYEFYQKEIDMS